MPRVPAAVRGLVPHRLALIAVVVTATLSATLLAALVSFAATVTGYAVRATLRSSPATSILVTAPAGSAAGAAREFGQVRAALHRALPGGPLTVAGSLSTDFLDIPAQLAGSHAQIHVISLPSPARHATLVAGAWPHDGGAGPAVPVAVPSATAARLRLRPGSVLALQVAATGTPVTVRVTGVFRRARQGGGYWSLDPANSAVPLTVGGFTVYPSLVTSQAALTAHKVPVNAAAWVISPDTGRIGAGSLAALGTAVQLGLARLGSAPGLHGATVTTGLPGLLAGLDRAVVVARSQLAVGILILLVIAGATLALAVSLLSRQREAEATLLRARGASRSQLTRTGLAEAVLLVLPAAALGPILGGLLLPVLARRGPLAHSALRIGVAFPVAAWLASIAAAAGCALVIARTWLNAAQSPVRARAQRGRQQALAAAARSGVDVALVALAVLASWQLAHNILAGLDTPTAGRARVAGHDLLAMSTRERLEYRRETVGFLWQQTSRNLFSHLTAAENIALPMRLAARSRRARGRRAAELLDALGVGYCRDRMPAEMSGGEQQRVAIGVALANEPAVLLADEPTGELDTGTGEEVFAALRTANSDLGVTILVVTHDQQVSEQVRRTIAIRDGRISTEVLRHTHTDAEGREADVAQEYAVLDRAGRLQIPRDFMETLDMRDRVLLALESDHVGVWPDTGPGSGPSSRVRGRHERDSGPTTPRGDQQDA